MADTATTQMMAAWHTCIQTYTLILDITYVYICSNFESYTAAIVFQVKKKLHSKELKQPSKVKKSSAELKYLTKFIYILKFWLQYHIHMYICHKIILIKIELSYKIKFINYNAFSSIAR